MKLRVLTSFLLGFLYVMVALGESSARVILAAQKGNENELEVTRIAAMLAQKELSDRTGAGRAAHMRKLGLGRKKVMEHEDLSMAFKVDIGAEEGTSKITGKTIDALKKSIGSSQEQTNHQEKHIMLEPKAVKNTNFAIPRSSPTKTSSKSSQHSNAVQVKASLKSSTIPERQISTELQGTTRKDESQSLLEAAKEIVNLMNKDYKGMARRKPPINNHEPRN